MYNTVFADVLAARVYDAVKSDIIELSLLPGERLYISQLATKMNESRSIVKKALDLLVNDRLIVASDSKYAVAPLTTREFLDVLAAREGQSPSHCAACHESAQYYCKCT